MSGFNNVENRGNLINKLESSRKGEDEAKKL
jgi:hypothetical protein